MVGENISVEMSSEALTDLNGLIPNNGNEVKEEVEDRELETVKVEESTATLEELENSEGVLKEGEIKEGAEDVVEDEDNNTALLMANLLVENKVLENTEGIEDFNGLINAFNVKDDEIVKKYLDSLPEETRRLIELGEEGVSSDTSTKAVLDLAKLEKLDKIEDVDMLKELVMRDLKEAGYNDEYIKKRIEMAEDNDTLKFEGNIAKDRLVSSAKISLEQEKREVELRRQEQEKALQEWQGSIKTSINETLVNRYEISDNIKEDVFNKVVTPVRTVSEGGFERPVSFLEDAITKDPTLLPEITYYIMTGRIGKEAKVEKFKISDSIKAIERAMKKSTGKMPKGRMQRKSPMNNIKL